MTNLKMDSRNRVVIIINGATSLHQGSSKSQWLTVHGNKKPYVQALKQKFYLEDLEQIQDYTFCIGSDEYNNLKYITVSQFIITIK